MTRYAITIFAFTIYHRTGNAISMYTLTGQNIKCTLTLGFPIDIRLANIILE